MAKYKLTEEQKVMPGGEIVFRIEALIDIPWVVNKGQRGGFIEGIENLSNLETDTSWVSDEAVVMGEDTRVEGNVEISGNATVSVGCDLSGFVRISGKTYLTDTKLKGEKIFIEDQACLSDVILTGTNIKVAGDADLYAVRTLGELENVEITGAAQLEGEGNAPFILRGTGIFIEENVKLLGSGNIDGKNIRIRGFAELEDGFSLTGENILIEDYASIGGDVRLGNNCHLKEFASIVENPISFDPVLSDIHLSGDVSMHVGELYEWMTGKKS